MRLNGLFWLLVAFIAFCASASAVNNDVEAQNSHKKNLPSANEEKVEGLKPFTTTDRYISSIRRDYWRTVLLFQMIGAMSVSLMKIVFLVNPANYIAPDFFEVFALTSLGAFVFATLVHVLLAIL